ncbi:hypothetical protein FHS70_000983 [Flammeovirga yaeyamensis]|nr:hypothetical protein [Flammeovirga yaeyamensis]
MGKITRCGKHNNPFEMQEEPHFTRTFEVTPSS